MTRVEKLKEKKFIAVVVALITKGDEILMTLRNEKINPKAHLKWDFPGGKINFGEKPDTTIIREVKEETGYPIKIIEQIPATYTSIWEYPDFSQHTLLLGFRCAIIGKQKNVKDKKVKTIKWWKIKEINYSETLRGIKYFIKQITKKVK